MNAIILAAGKGERLHPLTEKKPKCLIELFGKSLLQWQIETFQAFGINDITVISGYKSEQIQTLDIDTVKNEKYDSTNMVESLFCADDKLSNSTIVSYGDIIFESKVLKKIIESKDNFSVVVDKNWLDYWKIRFEDPLNDAESLKINDSGYITSIGQKVTEIDEIQGQYIGLMKFQNEGINFLKSFYTKAKEQSKSGINILNPKIKFENSYMTDLLNSLIDSGCRLKDVEVEHGWLELDSISDYKIYEEMFSNGTLEKIFSIPR